MTRSALLLFALTSASLALATPPVVTDAQSGQGTCPQRAASTEQPATANSPSKPAANQKPEQTQAPVTSGSSRRTGARWQSLLPGMFR